MYIYVCDGYLGACVECLILLYNLDLVPYIV